MVSSLNQTMEIRFSFHLNSMQLTPHMMWNLACSLMKLSRFSISGSLRILMKKSCSSSSASPGWLCLMIQIRLSSTLPKRKLNSKMKTQRTQAQASSRATCQAYQKKTKQQHGSSFQRPLMKHWPNIQPPLKKTYKSWQKTTLSIPLRKTKEIVYYTERWIKKYCIYWKTQHRRWRSWWRWRRRMRRKKLILGGMVRGWNILSNAIVLCCCSELFY